MIEEMMVTATEPDIEDGRVRASYSSLETHRACPQKWVYGKVRGLRRIEDSEPACERDFGSWWHAVRAADALERGRDHGTLRGVPTKVKTTDDSPDYSWPGTEVTVFDVMEAAMPWWLSRTEGYRAEFVSRIGQSLPERLLGLYERWRDHWAEEIAWERPIAVEMGWGRDLPAVQDALTGEMVDPRTRLVGYVDEVYLDTRRNVVVVRDHKTSKELAAATAVDDMMDSQLQFYAWGVAPQVSEWGYKIGATAYDRVRSVAPKPPQLTLSGRLTQTNGRSNIGQTDLRTYLEWCESGPTYPGTKKDGSGAGVYEAEQAVIERLSMPSAASVWFQRTLVPLSGNIVRAHLRAAVDSAIDVGRTRARAEASGGMGARNLGRACRWCDFVGLCRAEMIGGLGDYDLAQFNLTTR